MPQNGAERPFSPICVHSLSPRLSTTAHLTERHTLHSPLDRGETKKRILLQRLTKNRSLVSPGVVECAFPSRRGAREVWGNPPRQAAGHYGEWLNWADALEQPPARLRGGLRECPQISVRSLASRKGALCPTGGLQNAPFRRVRFSSPGQTWRRLTEKRTLAQPPHGKAHSAADATATVYTNSPERRREAVFADLCTLFVPTAARATG